MKIKPPVFAIIFIAICKIVLAGEFTPVLLGVLHPEEGDVYAATKLELETSFYYAIGRVESKLNSCGYSYQTAWRYYHQDKKIQIKQEGEKLKKLNPWIVFGPKRSGDYLLTEKSLRGIPLVSALANASKVFELPPPVFSMTHSIPEMVEATLADLKNRDYKKRYASLVRGVCVFCRNYSRVFDEIALKQNYQKQFELSVSRKDTNFDEIFEMLSKNEVDFLLLPNYSRLSGALIREIHKKYPHIKYVGGDGWGTEETSLLTQSEISESAEGIAVRTTPRNESHNTVVERYSLKKNWRGRVARVGVMPYMILKFVEKTTDVLCTHRPKNREDFIKVLSQQNSDFFREMNAIGIYKFSKNRIRYQYSISKTQI